MDDLDEIWSFIASDNEAAANRVEFGILEACNLLARNPLIGSKREEITSQPVRFWVVTRYPNYTVIYRPDTKPLEVISIVHAKRNIRRLVTERMGS